MRKQVGLPSSVITKIIQEVKRLVSIDTYEEAKTLALSAQANGQYEVMTALLNEVSTDWKKWCDLVYQMEDQHPEKHACLEQIYEYWLDQKAENPVELQTRQIE